MKKEGVTALVAILAVLLLVVGIFFVAQFLGLTGKATVGTSSKGSVDKCWTIYNSNCISDYYVDMCMVFLATLEPPNNISESNTDGCVNVWKRANPGRENQIDELKRCALNYKRGLIGDEEFMECRENWNIFIEKLVASYSAPVAIGKEIGIFTESGRYVVFDANKRNNPWREITYDEIIGDYFDEEINKWVTESYGERGFIPRNLKIITSYYYPPNKQIGLWGEINGESKVLTYNRITKDWTDITSVVLTGETFDSSKSQWCVGSNCGVLPKNLKVELAYYFPLAGSERINIWGSVNGERVLMVWNPNQGAWADRTDMALSGTRFNEELSQWCDEVTLFCGVLPRDFWPVVGYYHPFGGGKINLFGEDGKLMVYDVSTAVWFDRTNMKESLGLPINKIPQTGYYDDIAKKIVLWYSGKEVYLSEGQEFSLSKDYLIRGRFPPTAYYLECDEENLDETHIKRANAFNNLFGLDLTIEQAQSIKKIWHWIDIKNLNDCDKSYVIWSVSE